MFGWIAVAITVPNIAGDIPAERSLHIVHIRWCTAGLEPELEVRSKLNILGSMNGVLAGGDPEPSTRVDSSSSSLVM